jgi:phosphohistidine phosphatase
MTDRGRKLILVRHAEAESPGSTGDQARQLTDKGRYDAHALGLFLYDSGIRPDMAICSPSIRTRQTLHGILESVPIAYREYPEELYNSSAGQLIDWIGGVEDRHSTLIVIGHNPEIHILARSLAGTLSVASPERFLSYPQGAMSVFSCNCSGWNEIAASENEMINFVTPDDYRSSPELAAASF